MASNSNFIHVKNDQHYRNLIKDAGERLIIVDFTASWCGPCHHIAPFFEKLSERFINVLFLKVDVDECQETAIGNGVSAMPTFHAIKNGVKVEEVKGANPHPLVSMIEKWVRLSQPDNKKETISVGRSFESFLELRKNPDEKFLDVSELLIKFASNVLKDQKSEKYRTVRLENKIFQSRLLPVAGAVESLFTMGFEEQDDKLVLPQGCPLANLVAMRDALIDEREKINLKNSPIDLPPPVVVQPKTRKWKPFIRNSKETSFYERLKSTSDHVFIYEDPVMVSFARLKIPLEELKKKAKEQSVSTGSPNGSVNDLVDERDCLLLLLLNWFKCDFFKWMDQPTCTFCDVGTHSIGHVMPTSVDRKWGAGTVESYNCPQCSRKFTFPRYNHPQKLLETRTGRCGEWANCFTACCRAAGFEARYVLDWTDHVWTEVYSEHQKRWLHCDACENVCDKPLLYEAGWGKKLTYVFAFSKDEVIDVTWRYSQDHNENLKRRNEVGESWLVSLWTNMSKELQSSLTDVRRKVLESRRIAELVEFLRTKEVNKGEKIGRQSGSVAWRKIRGEDGGHNDDAVTVSEEHHVFIPTMPELEDGRLRIRYCGASDEYMRGDGGSNDRNSVSIKGWENGTSKSKDVFRKVEHDWKMAYLARKEGFSDGYIEWKFRIDNPLFVFDQITLKLSSKTYENGSVMVILKNGEIAENIESSKGSTYESSKFKGCSELQIGVHLTGGKGDVAWQHAQLFRQTLDSKDEYPFDFDVTIFKK